MQVPNISTPRVRFSETQKITTYEVDQHQFTYDENLFMFDKDKIQNADNQLYFGHRTHFLIDALATNGKLPSERSMIRCEQRNKRKGAKIDQKKKRQERRHTKQFKVPNKYGEKPTARRNLRLQRFKQPQRGYRLNNIQSSKTEEKHNLTKQRQNVQIIQKSAPKGFCFTQLVNPQFLQLHSNYSKAQNLTQKIQLQQNKKLPAEIIRKKKKKNEPKKINNVFKVHSPEWIESKAKKRQLYKMIQHLRQKSKPKNVDSKKPIPEYFQKKKRHQQRRRLEKHTLIVSNRQALRQIFGDAIFKSGWPVSRKQIKQALGIEEQKSQTFENLTDLLKQMHE